jgi:hypothetical protein
MFRRVYDIGSDSFMITLMKNAVSNAPHYLYSIRQELPGKQEILDVVRVNHRRRKTQNIDSTAIANT